MSDDPSAGYFAQPRPAPPTYPSGYAPAFPPDGSWHAPVRQAAPSERPGVVVAAAVIALVQAGLVLLGAAVLAVLALGTRSALSDPTSNLSGLPVALAIIAFLVAAVAGVLIVAGLHLLRGRAWSAIVLGVVEGLMLFSALSGMSGQVGLATLVGAGCSAAVLVILVLPRTREFVGIS